MRVPPVLDFTCLGKLRCALLVTLARCMQASHTSLLLPCRFCFIMVYTTNIVCSTERNLANTTFLTCVAVVLRYAFAYGDKNNAAGDNINNAFIGTRQFAFHNLPTSDYNSWFFQWTVCTLSPLFSPFCHLSCSDPSYIRLRITDAQARRPHHTRQFTPHVRSSRHHMLRAPYYMFAWAASTGGPSQHAGQALTAALPPNRALLSLLCLSRLVALAVTYILLPKRSWMIERWSLSVPAELMKQSMCQANV